MAAAALLIGFFVVCCFVFLAYITDRYQAEVRTQMEAEKGREQKLIAAETEAQAEISRLESLPREAPTLEAMQALARRTRDPWPPSSH